MVHTKVMFAATIVSGGVLLALISYLGYADTRLPDVMSARSEAIAGGITKTNYYFGDRFTREETIEEAGSMEESHNLYWWVNSGAYLTISNGVSHTVQGELPEASYWQKAFADHSSGSTDGGFHPQNIFRLVTRTQWKNLQQEAYFKINKHNFSKDSHRNASNGLLLFNRYIDGDNLYYTGIRVDGAAVIKKKIKGAYYTLDYQSVMQGKKYDRQSNPTLLPVGEWIGIKSEVTTTLDNAVNIKLFLDKNGDGKWELVATAVDNGKTYGGEAITQQGHAGIRTDFVDASFKKYLVEEI